MTNKEKIYILEAEKEAELELEREGVNKKRLGYCHEVWFRQKKILKEKYGIDWKTPAEQNPDILYD